MFARKLAFRDILDLTNHQPTILVKSDPIAYNYFITHHPSFPSRVASFITFATAFLFRFL